jgi:protease I
MQKPLAGRKIGVLIESQYIPGEITTYQYGFEMLGAQVNFMSRLWNQPKQTFISTVENHGESPAQMDVTIDFDKVKLEDYAAIIMAANYTSVRLRYFTPPEGQPPIPSAAMVATAPAVAFFARAMENPKIVKGALCHGLWLLTPRPDLLRGRRVICHEVVMADVVNAGAQIHWDESGVVVDRDLVTGHDWHTVGKFVERVADTIVAINAA